MKKTLVINIAIFCALILFIECIFGYWFKENNFGIYMRSERNRSDLFNVTHNDKEYTFYYKRNFYAFRGDEFDPSDVEVVFEGGSTGNEKFTPEEYTIIGNLNKYFKENNSEIIIYNASTDGKTTRGYVNDFLYWFPKIPNFNPKFFIFYIGMNDRKFQYERYDYKFPTTRLKKLRDYIKNNSIILEMTKKIENKYFPQLTDVYVVSDKELYKNFVYVNFEAAKKKHSLNNLTEDEKSLLLTFKTRLENLKKIIEKNKFIPIFITQIKFNGLSDKNLFLINQELKRFSKSNNFDLIALDELINNMEINDYFDQLHTSIRGSEKIAMTLYPHLKKILKYEKN